MTLRTKDDATGNELTGSRWQKKKPMNDTNNQNKTLRGESSEIRLQNAWKAKVVAEANQMGFDVTAAELLGELFVAARERAKKGEPR